MIADKLSHYFPGSQWSMTGESYDSLNWIGPGEKPTEAEIDALAWPVVKPEAVVAERARRLSAGFDFDFGDARGVHRIGTTEADMRGWDEVSKGAQAAINLGQPGATLQIVTDTGPVELTAQEWQLVLSTAAQARQPIYSASFALQAMDPIPADYADDSYWP